MGRRGSGFGTVIKVVKAVDRAQKQAARNADQDRRRREREAAAEARERERERRARDRDAAAKMKANWKLAKEAEKEAYEKRVKQRAALRVEFVRAEVN